MDRKIIYPGAIPLDDDLLMIQVAMMTALGWLAQGILGTDTLVDGLSCIPTSPATLTVQVLPGQIFKVDSVDASDFGSVDADTTHQIVKQGLHPDTQTFTYVPPSTSGYAQNFLIQAAFSQADDTPIVLPYYNPDNPAVGYSGPNGSGDPQNTFRRGKCIVSSKAGTPATSGTQTTPTADAGYTPLYVITVANGATTITSGNIVAVATAPFIDPKLPAVPAAVQSGKWNSAIDTGTANAMVAAFTPAITALRPGMTLVIKKINANNTGAMTVDVGLGTNALVKANGSAMSADDVLANQEVQITWTGSNWQATNYLGVQSSTSTVTNNYSLSIPYAVDSGTTNAIVAVFSPAIVSFSGGDQIKVKLANDITDATTITVNSMSPIAVVRPDGWRLRDGDAVAGQELVLQYDGTSFQIVSALAADGARVTGDYYLLPYESTARGTVPTDGALLARAGKYARLFAKIGTRYGVGDGVTTFAVPNTSGLFLRSWNNGASIDPDAASRTDSGGGITGDHVGTKQAGAAGAVSISGAAIQINNPLIGRSNGAGGYIWTGIDLASNANVDGTPIQWLSPTAGTDVVGTYIAIKGTMTVTGNSGSTETRPKNINVKVVIAY